MSISGVISGAANSIRSHDKLMLFPIEERFIGLCGGIVTLMQGFSYSFCDDDYQAALEQRFKPYQYSANNSEVRNKCDSLYP